ncbi:huntingtin, partial [Aphelenchoides avenae]
MWRCVVCSETHSLGVTEGSFIRVICEQEQIPRESLPSVGDNHLLDRIITLYLRVLNFYYTILAEEKSKAQVANSSVLSRPNLTPLSPKLGEESQTNRITFLVGTGIHPNRPSSYTFSSSLKNLDSQFRGAYKNYTNSLNPDAHARFIEPLEAALEGLSCIIEMLSHVVCKTFLDELLLYLKNLFDSATALATTVINQLLKALFGKNGANVNIDTLQSMRLKDPLPPTDEFEIYLSRSVHEFTMFTAFAGKPDFVELHFQRHVGWLRRKIFAKVHVATLADVKACLQQFEKFITHIVNIYAATNSSRTRAAILHVMCTLVLNDVRYQLIDPSSAFLNRVLAQLNQMANGADVVLLSDIFTFLCVLARVDFMTFSDVESKLSEVCSRIDESNAANVLSAVHVVLLEALVNRREVPSSIRAFLIKDNCFLFRHADEATAQLWSLLLHWLRTNDQDRWSETSVDFFASFTSSLTSTDASSTNRQPSRLPSIDCVHSQMVLLSCCSPSTF